MTPSDTPHLKFSKPELLLVARLSQMNGIEEPFSVTDWVSKHVSVTIGSRKGFACHISASAVMPLSAAQAYELLTHPLNSEAFRGIDKCAYRRVLSADEGCGRLVVEVENISGEWQGWAAQLIIKLASLQRRPARGPWHCQTPMVPPERPRAPGWAPRLGLG